MFAFITYKLLNNMKKMYFIKGVLLAFLAFQFFSCENEPLTGEFIQEEQNNANEGQFIAQIEGQEFIANSVTATLYTTDNKLIISGLKPGGEEITLKVDNPEVGSFNLSHGGANNNGGYYFDGSTNLSPYVSADSLGGYGLMNITALDASALTITGTFSFVGSREKVDGDGNPILDGNGDPVIEDIAISNGAFNAIPYIVDDTNGGGGGGTGDPNNEFFAKVEGVDFVADSIYVSEPMVGDVHMIKIEAKSNTGELIRIDIPRSLGIGTFNMVNISDGTKLIALYNAGNGAENLTSNPGMITISEFDLELGILKAAFSFTGNDPLSQVPDTVEVTEGSFTVYFEGVPGANNAFTANVDGASYTPDEIVITTSIVNQYPRITISTTIGDQRMELTFPATVTIGTFDMGTEVIDGDEIVAYYTPQVGTSITYVSSPGSLVITNYDIPSGLIEGTFNFTGRDGSGQDPSIYQITGGEFLIVLP
ncbi:DUF6252 family protein [Aequorivita sp. CIP111184]|uniref:DUF6252 family protein n=1 Tax=Aequorivita sp. CIP111184 TaxID=2211356 RepID=UPI000DBBC5F3|nr:DUF6252 family protein [Aequorivita sp. CIP111184]SRX55818.1 hypothetical protein AEQU1_02843 [Aequorivita sp. CIP111184]